MKDGKRVTEAAKVLAKYDMYEWDTLPETDPQGRDRTSFKQIAEAMLEAADEGAN